MPEVRSRLYDFDVEQCDTAARLAEELASKYPENEQRTLNFQAENHARALSYNTSEPYQAVPACREYCRNVAEISDQRNAPDSQ